MNLDEKIKQHLPQDELLAQLAEECAELSQAALKLRRALTGINPTPVTAEEARKNLVEEAADVYNVLGLLLVLPCKVGDTVYEILEETVPNHHFYISEHKVQDVSVKAVKYADEWEPYDYENLYFTREEAEAALEKRRKDNGF